MKRAGLIAGGILVFVVAALLVGPSFVDWTAYRDTFERRIEAATGRTVDIDGGVSMTVLPRPALHVERVRIGSLPGATSSDFLAADSVNVNLSLTPLLAGRIQFSSIEVERPVILAEVLADGRATWQFTTESESASPVDDQNPAHAAGLELGIDELLVSGGTIRYRDRAAGTAYDIDGINAEINAGSMTGPFDVRGTAAVLGAEWDIESSLGSLSPDRPTSVAVKLSAPGSGLTLQFTGQAVTTGEQPQLTGRIEVNGDRLDASLAALGGDPSALDGMAAAARPLTVKGSVEASASGTQISDLDISIGDLTIQGTGAYDWLPAPRFDATLRVGRFSIDSWTEGSLERTHRFAMGQPIQIVRRARAQGDAAPGFRLPSNLNGALDLTVDLLEWRGQVLRNGRLAASLGAGEITVTESAIELPGNTSVAASGFIREERGQPSFDLTASAESQNVRGLLAWWDAEPPPDMVPPSRLNAVTVSTRVIGTLSELQLPDLRVTLDTTSLQGSAYVTNAAPIKIGVDLGVTSLDLDSYLPALRNRLSTRAEPTESLGGAQTVKPPDEQSSNNLAGFDASMRLRADSLTAGGYVIRGVEIDAVSTSGDVAVQKFAVADLAGMTVGASGRIANVFGTPRFDALRIQANATDPQRVARAFEIEVPRMPLMADPMSVDVSVTGTQEKANVAGTFSVGELSANVAGDIAAEAASSFSGRASIVHPDYKDLVRALGMEFPANANSPGAVSASADFAVAGPVLDVGKFKAAVGQNVASGALKINAQEPVTDVSGTIAIVEADFDTLLPVDETAALTQQSRARAARASSQAPSRWSAEPFPQGMFDGLAVNLTVTAGRLRARGLELETLQAPIKVSDGALDINQWTAKVFDGPSSGQIRVRSRDQIAVTAVFDMKDVDLSRTRGEDGAATQGTVSFQGSVSGQGASQRDLIASLGGRGVLAGRGLDAGRTGAAGLVGTLISPIRAISQIGGLLSGGVTKGLASIDASFAGEEGVFALSNATLKSNVYSGEFAGNIDLAQWWVDIQGRVRLEANLITQLLGNRIQMPSLIPVTVVGPLDAPNVKTDMAASGADQTATDAPAGQQVQPAQPVAPQPVDLFRGLLNELTKPK